MDSIDYEAWEVDVASGRALHASGFNLTVEGDVRNPSGVAPADYPPGLSYADQARLLRCGMEALASSASSSPKRSQRVAQVKTRARQAEEKAKLFAERKDRPERPKLSLKKPR